MFHISKIINNNNRYFSTFLNKNTNKFKSYFSNVIYTGLTGLIVYNVYNFKKLNIIQYKIEQNKIEQNEIEKVNKQTLKQLLTKKVLSLNTKNRISTASLKGFTGIVLCYIYLEENYIDDFNNSLKEYEDKLSINNLDIKLEYKQTYLCNNNIYSLIATWSIDNNKIKSCDFKEHDINIDNGYQPIGNINF